MASKKDNKSNKQDVIFHHNYSSSLNPNPSYSQTLTHNKPTNGSVGSSYSSFASSKSTLYVSNLDYSLTNSDLHTLFSIFGHIAHVTVLKDRQTRLSRGVAFIQFVYSHNACFAATQIHRKVFNGRTLTASIAIDNGRGPEFICKRVYRDNDRCYECGELGHLSYDCPRNQLGPRGLLAPKRGRWGGKGFQQAEEEEEEEDKGSDDDGNDEDQFEDDSWASVVDDGVVERLLGRNETVMTKKKRKKVGYFSDESDYYDDDE